MQKGSIQSARRKKFFAPRKFYFAPRGSIICAARIDHLRTAKKILRTAV